MIKIKFFISLLLKIFSLLIILSLVIYAFSNRNFQLIIENTFYIGSLINIILILYLIFVFFQDQKTEFRFRNIVFIIFLMFLLGLIIHSIAIVLEDLSLLQKKNHIYLYSNWKVPAIVFAILVIGFSLFYFRLYFRSIYGLIEATVGVIIGVNKVLEKELPLLNESTFYFAILTASIYLIVRGFDNVHQGFIKEPFDLAAKRLKKIID